MLHLTALLDPQSPLKGASYDTTVKLVAAMEFTSTRFIRDLHVRAAANESLAPAPVERIHRSDPRHMLFGMGGPPLFVELFLYAHIRDAQEENFYTSISSLQAAVLAATDVEVPRTTLQRWLHDLSIRYGKKKLTGLKHPYANALIRRYIFQYAELLRREKAGKIVLVWMDESYIHAGYCASRGWFIEIPGAVVQGRVQGTDKGMRIIIIHAMTRFGMLEVPIDVPCDDLGVELHSAGVVSVTLSADGSHEDYHDTMDGSKFCSWIRNRLIPAFVAKFGKKMTMCLMLDNAKYHHARGEDWLTPRLMKAPQLADALRQLKVLSVTDGKQVWPAKLFSRLERGSPDADKAPTAKLMRQVLSDYLKSHPGTNTTVVHQLMSENKHELLYTPPYESWLQPIELIWARVKHTVAMQSNRSRKYQQTQEQTRAALSAITAELCSKLVLHTEKLMTKWLSSPEAGSLSRWNTLEKLVAAKHEEVGKGADLEAVNFEEPQAEAEQQKTQAESMKETSSEEDTDEEEEPPAKKLRKGRSARRQLSL